MKPVTPAAASPVRRAGASEPAGARRPAGVMLTMTGHERQAAVVMMVAAAGQIGLSVALIPRFGVEGAAVANAVSLIGWNLALAVPTWRKLRIVPSILARR